MACKVNELEERKRQLLLRSELHRRALDEDLREIKIATAWVPRTIRTFRALSPVLFLATPFFGYIFGKKRSRSILEKPPRRRGMVASALAGYQLFRRVKPLWDGLRSWRDGHKRA